MINIVIDKDFKELLPALDEETYKLLEKNLLENGCRDALVLWGDVLVDGHNRYAICTEHGIPFNTVNKDFATKEDALIWIITTQVSRRNLTPMQLTHYRGLHYRADKKIQGSSNQFAEKSENGQNDHFHSTTAKRLAKHYKVGEKTIRRDAKISDALDVIGEFSPEAKMLILSGDIALSKKNLAELAAAPAENLEALAIAIKEGRYEKPKPEMRPALEEWRPVDSILVTIRPLNKAITSITDSFSGLPEVKKQGERTELKTALRPSIDTLDELYKRI